MIKIDNLTLSNNMTKDQLNLIRNKIIKCLTEDFEDNEAIFDKKYKWQIYHETDLDMIIEKIDKGLELYKNELN